MKTLSEAADFLRARDKLVILTHESPDGDTLGCGFALYYALRQLGKRARVENSDPIPPQFSYLCADYQADDFAPDTVVSVDVADVKLLGKLRPIYEGRIDLCLDHHRENRTGARHCYVESDSAAACEIIYFLLRELSVSITPQIADCLFTGLATDTGCFQFSNTTPRTHRIAAELMEKTEHTGQICQRLFGTKSKSRLLLEKAALEQMRFYRRDTVAVLTLTLEQTASVPGADLDGIAALPRMVEGVGVGVTLKQKEPETFKVSMRSVEPYDVAAICKQFGGGGHARAAGCTLCGSAELVCRRLLEVIFREMDEVEA